MKYAAFDNEHEILNVASARTTPLNAYRCNCWNVSSESFPPALLQSKQIKFFFLHNTFSLEYTLGTKIKEYIKSWREIVVKKLNMEL